MATQPIQVTPDLDRLVTAHLNIRAARGALAKRFEEEDDKLKTSQETIESVLLKHLNDTKSKTVRTDAGTFYRQEEIKPSCQDWTAYYDWIKANDAFEGLEKRVGKKFIKDHMDEHEGVPPPGISVHKEFVVRVRRPQ